MSVLEGQAARRECRATCMTKSSSEKQWRAIRIAVKTANESCIDRSPT